MLTITHLTKNYRSKMTKHQVTALDDVSFDVAAGEFVAIMGESGSGKSTLLNCLATLDRPSSGEISLNGTAMTQLSDSHLAGFRQKKLGFVFQEFNLLDTLSTADNIYLPLVLAKDTANKENKLRQVAKMLGIESLLSHYPYELSGGQKQRVAIARALITHPDLLLADEPTGALDSKNANDIMTCFDDCQKRGQTILMVTHSSAAASHAQRVLFIKDGRLCHQIYRGDRSRHEMALEINTAMINLLGGDQ